jgi:hypothetical protein
MSYPKPSQCRQELYSLTLEGLPLGQSTWPSSETSWFFPALPTTLAVSNGRNQRLNLVDTGP